MSDRSHVIELSRDGAPQKPSRSVRELGKHLGIDFAPSNLPLSMIALARRVESLEFELRLLRHELRRPMWRRAIDRLRGGHDEKV